MEGFVKIIHSGLGNRMLHLMKLIRDNPDKKINIYWNVNNHCNGRFDECFLPIENLIITSDNDTNVNHKFQDDHAIFKSLPTIEECGTLIHSFRLTPDLEQKVDNFVLQLDKYISIHIL